MNSKDSRSGKRIIDTDVKMNAMNWDVVGSKLIVRTKNIQNNQFSNWGVPILKGKRTIVFNERNNNQININVETWADVDSKTYMCWGDYWVKEKLLKAFSELDTNVNVAPQDADVTIYLWGSAFPQRHNFPFMYNPKTYNIAWFYSHPDKMTESEIKRYDTIFCLSKQYILVLNKKHWHENVISEPLLPCSDFKFPENRLKDNIDILFVGNSRGGLEFGRKAIYWLKPPAKTSVRIYGHKWYRQPQYSNWFADTYWDYEKLNELYNVAKITLIDGHDDMNKNGFVQVKILDVISSGGFPLPFYNTGMEYIFGNLIPMYKNKEQMNNMIKYYLENESERKIITEKAKKIINKFSYKRTASILLNNIKERQLL